MKTSIQIRKKCIAGNIHILVPTLLLDEIFQKLCRRRQLHNLLCDTTNQPIFVPSRWLPGYFYLPISNFLPASLILFFSMVPTGPNILHSTRHELISYIMKKVDLEMKRVLSLIHQILLECLLCARHFLDMWDIKVNNGI